MSTARIALDVLCAVTYDDAYANLALDKALSHTKNAHDERFVRALVYTALEHLAHIDYVTEHYVKGRQHRVIKNILRLGVCQILFMQRPKSAVCNECVSLTREVGKAPLAGYVNAVLRNICKCAEENELPGLPRNITERLHVETGYPMWLISEYTERFGAERAEAILKYTDSTQSVRVQYPFDADSFEKYCSENGVNFEKNTDDENVFRISGFHKITDSELFLSGKITLQSAASAMVCRLCDVKPHMRILDACAAPGGKSAYLASLTKGECEITACELHEHRRLLTEKTFERLHVSCAKAYTRDMTVKNPDWEGLFDVVLCDVPCSGLGVTGKPDARYRKDANSVSEITKTQWEILHTCADYVKVGGSLIYSTCTASFSENERIIERFLSKHKEFLPDSRMGVNISSRIQNRCKDGMLHILPDTDGTDGFFASKMVRIK